MLSRVRAIWIWSCTQHTAQCAHIKTFFCFCDIVAHKRVSLLWGGDSWCVPSPLSVSRSFSLFLRHPLTVCVCRPQTAKVRAEPGLENVWTSACKLPVDCCQNGSEGSSVCVMISSSRSFTARSAAVSFPHTYTHICAFFFFLFSVSVCVCVCRTSRHTHSSISREGIKPLSSRKDVHGQTHAHKSFSLSLTSQLTIHSNRFQLRLII